MGVSAQLSERRRPRRGLAIPAALFAMVIIAALTTAIFLLSDIQTRAVRNRESMIPPRRAAAAPGGRTPR